MELSIIVFYKDMEIILFVSIQMVLSLITFRMELEKAWNNFHYQQSPAFTKLQ